MAHLRVTLLGGFEAASSSGATVTLPTKKARALLAYCALRPGETHQREKLAALLWGDTREDNARNSLRQALFLLRTALREIRSSAFRIDNDTVTADPQSVDVDVQRFEQLLAKKVPGALEQAVAVYRGDLLDGFVVDEEPFEQWLLQERERLREHALDALARLLRHQNSDGATEAAIQTARRLLALDPLQEAVHRVLMRLHVRAGRREAALRQYEVCVGLLRRELQLGPEPETRQLHEEVLRMRERAPAPVFEEQRPELAQAAAAQDAAPNGGGHVITIPRRHFPPRGSDLWERYQEKVAVVQEALSRAHQVRMASARCLTTSRQALVAARTVNTQALEASRRLLQVAQSGSRLGDLGSSVDFETLAIRSPQ